MPYNFRFQPDIVSALDPWRFKLGDEFENAVARLADRDRQIEDYLSFGVSQGVLDYAEITVDATGLGGATTDIPGLSVGARVPGGRALRITARATLTNDSGTTGTFGHLLIREGSTTINLAEVVWAATNDEFPGSNSTATAVAFITPTQGLHTYKVSTFFGSGSTNYIETSNNPAFILVEDIGPSSVLD